MFTSNQIQEILNKLKICGVKDTHFSRAQLVNLTDDITIIQNNKNKILSVQKLLDCFEEYISGGTSGNSVDFFNVSKYGMLLDPQVTSPVAYTLEEAVATCPDAVKYSGQVITFLNSTDNVWYCFQYTNSDIDNWSILFNWNQIFPSVTEEEDPVFTHSPAAQLTQSDVDKLRGVENGAQKNVQADWDEIDSDSNAFIKNKPQSFVNVVVPDPTPVLNFGQTTTIAAIDDVNVEVEMPPSPTPSPASAQKLKLMMGLSTLGEYNPFDPDSDTTIHIPSIGDANMMVYPDFISTDGDKLATIEYGDLNNNPLSFNIYSNTKKTIPVEQIAITGAAVSEVNICVPNKVIQGTDTFITASETDYEGLKRFKNWIIGKYNGNTWQTYTVYENPYKIAGDSTTTKLRVTAVYEDVSYSFVWLTDWSQCLDSNDGTFWYSYVLNQDGNAYSVPSLAEWTYNKLGVDGSIPLGPSINWNELGELISQTGSWSESFYNPIMGDYHTYVWTITTQTQASILPSEWESFLGSANLKSSLKDSSKIYYVLEEYDSTNSIQYITLFKYLSQGNPYDDELLKMYAGDYVPASGGWIIISRIPKTIDSLQYSSIGHFIANTYSYQISYDQLKAWIARFSGNNPFILVETPL